MLWWMLISFLICVVLSCLAVIFGKQYSCIYTDELDSFDCGFDTLESCRVAFAVHFFLVGVVFVVFDAELLTALPLVMSPICVSYWWFWYIFTSLLLLGLVVEFFIRTIDWNE